MPKIINFPQFADSRGILTVAESALPFAPRRIFWISNADGHLRGGHRHKKTRMILFALAGTVHVSVQSSSSESGEFKLTASNEGLLLEPEDWHTMRFSDSAVLLVAASETYDADDYITEPYVTGN